jgi:branched-chain amino acid transport system permease protein
MFSLSPATADLIVASLLLGGLYVTISIGLNLVFGVMRVMNFAHGEFVMLAMYAVYWAYEAGGIDPYVAGLLVVPAVFLLCVTVLRPFVLWLVNSPPLVQVFATLGLSIALQNLALLLWAGNYRSIQTSYSNTLVDLASTHVPLTRLVAFVVAFIVVIALHLFMKHSFFGKAVRATAQNRRTARLMGINVERVYVLVFALGTSIAALAGVLLMPIYSVYPGAGFQLALIAFVVVVLGGLGSLPGAVLGGLLIGIVEVCSGYFLAPSMKQIVYFAVFILVLVTRPAGLLGQRGAEELGLK